MEMAPLLPTSAIGCEARSLLYLPLLLQVSPRPCLIPQLSDACSVDCLEGWKDADDASWTPPGGTLGFLEPWHEPFPYSSIRCLDGDE